MNNKRLLKSILLAEGERVILIARPSLWRWFWLLLICIILVFGDFFFIYPLVQLGDWGLIIFALVQLLALIILLKISRRYYFTALILTNKKIIDLDQLGYFNRAISQQPLPKIGSIQGKASGLGGALLGLGDIFLSLPETGSQIVISKIKNFKNIVSIIASEQEKYLENNYRQNRTPAEALAELKDDMAEEKFPGLLGDND